RSAETIDEYTSAARLHEVRIDAKKLRYLVDITPAFYDAEDFQCILRVLKKLQRVLGDFNDAHVQERRLLEGWRGLGGAGRAGRRRPRARAAGRAEPGTSEGPEQTSGQETGEISLR